MLFNYKLDSIVGALNQAEWRGIRTLVDRELTLIDFEFQFKTRRNNKSDGKLLKVYNDLRFQRKALNIFNCKLLTQFGRTQIKQFNVDHVTLINCDNPDYFLCQINMK